MRCPPLKVRDFYSHRKRMHPDKIPSRGVTIHINASKTLDAIERSIVSSLEEKYSLDTNFVRWKEVLLPDLPPSFTLLIDFIKAWYSNEGHKDETQFMSWVVKHFKRVCSSTSITIILNNDIN